MEVFKNGMDGLKNGMEAKMDEMEANIEQKMKKNMETWRMI